MDRRLHEALVVLDLPEVREVVRVLRDSCQDVCDSIPGDFTDSSDRELDRWAGVYEALSQALKDIDASLKEAE